MVFGAGGPAAASAEQALRWAHTLAESAAHSPKLLSTPGPGPRASGRRWPVHFGDHFQGHWQEGRRSGGRPHTLGAPLGELVPRAHPEPCPEPLPKLRG